MLDERVLGEVTDVTYELEIFQPGLSPVESVSGLENPEYFVTASLRPCTNYYWRPRARFRYRGVIHTTSLNKRRWAEGIYLNDDFLIKTPSAACKEPGWGQLDEPATASESS